MGSNKRIILNTGVLYIRVILTLIVSLLSTRYVLEALGETDFGLYNLIAGVVTLLSFLSTSMSSCTQRYMSYEKGRNKDLQGVRNVFECAVTMHFWTAVCLFFFVIIGGAFLIAFVLNIPLDKTYDAFIVLVSVGISLAGTILQVPYDAVLMARENIVFVAICQFSSALLRLLFAIIVLVISGNHLIEFSISTALIPYLTLVSERWFCKSHYEEVNNCLISLKLTNNPLAKQMGNFMSLTLFGALGWSFRTQGYAIILNMFWGVVINAANGIATQVSNAITTFSTSLTTSMRPQLIQAIAANNERRSLQLIDWSCKFPILLVCLLSIPVFVMLPDIMKIWLTIVPPHTVFFCRCLLIAMILNQATQGLAICLDANGRIKQLHLLVGSSLIGCTLIAFFCCLLYKSVSLIYLLLIVNNLFICVIRVILTHKYARLSIRKFVRNTIIPPFVVGLITFTVIYFIWNLIPHSFPALISIGLLSVAIFSLLSIYLVFSATERKAFLQKLHTALFNR